MMSERLFIVSLVTYLYVILVSSSDDILRSISEVSCLGCAGFEFFSVNDKPYLASASFWDGQSQDMSSFCHVYTIDADSDTSVSLSLTSTQRFLTNGAHGVDYFEYNPSQSSETMKFLVIPSYYGCERRTSDSNCHDTLIYQWDESTQQFEVFQGLHANGPAQTDHFIHNGILYIAIAENLSNKISIYKLASCNPNAHCSGSSQFIKHQDISCIGAASIAIESFPTGEIILVGGSYYNRGWETSSPVFISRLTDDGSLKFQLIQYVETNAAHDAEMIWYRDELYLFISEDRDEETSDITSSLLKYSFKRSETLSPQLQAQSVDLDGSSVQVPSQKVYGEGRFELIQRIPTDGAHAAEMFIIDDRLFLAIANFGDRQSNRVAARSTIWTLNTSYIPDSNQEGQSMIMLCEVPTQGATDWEHFEWKDRHYLVVSNEGDFQAMKDPSKQEVKSVMYLFKAPEVP